MAGYSLVEQLFEKEMKSENQEPEIVEELTPEPEIVEEQQDNFTSSLEINMPKNQIWS